MFLMIKDKQATSSTLSADEKKKSTLSLSAYSRRWAYDVDIHHVIKVQRLTWEIIKSGFDLLQEPSVGCIYAPKQTREMLTGLFYLMGISK